MRPIHAFFFSMLVLIFAASCNPARADVVETSSFSIEFDSKDRNTASYLEENIEGVARRIKEETELTPKGKIRVVIARDLDRFRTAHGSSRRLPPMWAAGLAYPGQRLIVLKSPKLLPGADILDIFVHEYVHILLGESFGTDPIPTWLNEGLAMYLSREWDWSRPVVMTRAVLTNGVIPLSRIEGEFPEDPETARLAYAESYYLVAFLRERLGPGGLYRFIDYYRRGFGFKDSLRRSGGMEYKELEEQWLRFLKVRFSMAPLLTSSGVLWFVMALLFLLAYRNKKKRAKEKLREWEEEEFSDSLGRFDEGP